MLGKGDKWSAGQIDLLRELAPTGIGRRGIAMKLGRTLRAISVMASKLGIPIAPPSRGSQPTGDWYWKSIIGPMKERVRADVQRIMAS
jgi:hypothetical protein